jgi:2'-5' RNA ligase
MTPIWRMFIALELPSAASTELSEIQKTLKQGTPPGVVRWVNPNDIHLTLKFLGDVSVSKRDGIEQALREAAANHDEFSLTAGGLGCFPNFERPRVAWVAIHENLEALRDLWDTVEKNTAPLGFPTENRSFRPHLTLGRTRRQAQKSEISAFGELVNSTQPRKLFRWRVRSVSLIRSELKPTGAVYTVLCHAPLRPPESQ